MFTVALTGGIASGKSAAARCFSELGVTVIDADQIVHALTLYRPAVFEQIVDYFGPSVLTEDKQLNRSQLREIAFANSKDRAWLEELLHPLVYEEIHSSLQTARSIYCLVVIPLLFEERMARLQKEKPTLGVSIELNRLLLVAASQELQVQRVQARDRMEKKQIEAILATQISAADGFCRADDIIYNEMTLRDLRCAIERFHRMYLSFANAKNIVLEPSAFLRYYIALK